jgi:hypothetical protein
MGLLSGSASVTRFNVSTLPPVIDFDSQSFREIEPASEVRESQGFIPMEPGAPWEIGARRFAFRVRIDKLRPDSTAVRERLRELIASELETGAEFVGPKRRKQLRELAEEELVAGAAPTTKIIEAAIDGDICYVGSTAKNYLGVVMQLLRRVGVVVEVKAPWVDRREGDVESQIVHVREPGESVLGCRFLKALVGDREVLIEPESGLVRLQEEDTRVTLAGAVLRDLHFFLERGDCEMLSAKLVTGETAFTFDALSFRVSNLRVETGRHEHWTELLDERLEKVAAIYELLDRKYDELRSEMA